MRRHPGNRLLAWIIDWLFVLVWVAVVAAVGVPLYQMGYIRTLPTVWLNVIATVILVIPVTVMLALLESRVKAASFGKRATRLVVVDAGTSERMSFGQAIARNSAKIALPWTIGHAAVYAIAASNGTGAVPNSTWILTAIAYILPISYVVSLFLGSGRTPYDRLCGTAVVSGRAEA